MKIMASASAYTGISFGQLQHTDLIPGSGKDIRLAEKMRQIN